MATAEDSGRLLANVCEEEVPDEFWNRFYNISSGPSFRLTNYEFESKLLKAIGCPAPEKIFEPNWFAIRNFHGQWYTDSDLLEDICISAVTKLATIILNGWPAKSLGIST